MRTSRQIPYLTNQDLLYWGLKSVLEKLTRNEADITLSAEHDFYTVQHHDDDGNIEILMTLRNQSANAAETLFQKHRPGTPSNVTYTAVIQNFSVGIMNDKAYLWMLHDSRGTTRYSIKENPLPKDSNDTLLQIIEIITMRASVSLNMEVSFGTAMNLGRISNGKSITFVVAKHDHDGKYITSLISPFQVAKTFEAEDLTPEQAYRKGASILFEHIGKQVNDMIDIQKRLSNASHGVVTVNYANDIENSEDNTDA